MKGRNTERENSGREAEIEMEVERREEGDGERDQGGFHLDRLARPGPVPNL